MKVRDNNNASKTSLAREIFQHVFVSVDNRSCKMCQYHHYGLRLEYARTLHCYGRVLADLGQEENGIGRS